MVDFAQRTWVLNDEVTVADMNRIETAIEALTLIDSTDVGNLTGTVIWDLTGTVSGVILAQLSGNAIVRLAGLRRGAQLLVRARQAASGSPFTLTFQSYASVTDANAGTPQQAILVPTVLGAYVATTTLGQRDEISFLGLGSGVVDMTYVKGFA
jgi:hypothetical protein